MSHSPDRKRIGSCWGVALAAAVTLSACAGSDRPADSIVSAGDAASSTIGAPPAPASPDTSSPATAPAATTMPIADIDVVSVAERAEALCVRPVTGRLGTIDSADLDEASGLVASRRHTDVLWTHDDGGESPGVFALGMDGTVRGFHPLDDHLDDHLGDVVDIEDIALVSDVSDTGGDGDSDELLLADIGDNGAGRDSIAVYRVPEPDPARTGPIIGASVVRFRYPDRPHNAEAMLVDEAERTIVIVTKEQEAIADGSTEFGRTLPSFVFEGPLDVATTEPVELTLVGMIDMPGLSDRVGGDSPNPLALLRFGGVPTGGDVSADGSLVALRTYEAAWVWPRDPGRSVAETLTDPGVEPCQVTTAIERQGEAIAFLDTTTWGDALATISEGTSPHLYASS